MDRFDPSAVDETDLGIDFYNATIFGKPPAASSPFNISGIVTADPKFDPDDITPLEQQHREVMLDLVLAWGSLDNALGVLLSSVRELTLAQGAELIGKKSNAAKLKEVCKVLKASPGGEDAARIIEKHQKDYEQHASPRNRIAHSQCVGVWTKDRDVVVFATFEKVADDELAVDLVPIQVMQRSARWGRAMRDMAVKIADALVAKD